MGMKEYVLWGGGLLVVLVVAHGLWQAWRSRRARNVARAESDLDAVSGDTAQMDIFEPPVLNDVDDAAAAEESVVVGADAGVGTDDSMAPAAGEREGLAPRMEEPSAGEREGLAPRMEEPSAGEREGLAARMKEPSAGEREGLAPRMKEPSAGEREWPAPAMEEPSVGEREWPAPGTGEPSVGEREGPAPRTGEPSAGEREEPAAGMEEPLAAEGGGPAPEPNIIEPEDDGGGKRGRRIVIPGKRTEPTVPRNDHLFKVRTSAPEPSRAPPAPPGLDHVVVIWVAAKDATSFGGHELVKALADNGLRYGNDALFRKFDVDSGEELFSVVNGIEPGTFDLSDLDALSTPRIVMLLSLVNATTGLAAFSEMLDAAQDISISLGGELRDENMGPMTGQTIEHYRQRISDYKRKSLRK